MTPLSIRCTPRYWTYSSGWTSGTARRRLRVGHVGWVELAQRAVGARERAGELGDDDVVAALGLVGEDRHRAGLDLVGVLLLDDQAAVELGAPEVAERLVLDHDHALVEPGAGRRHPAQAAAERLLGEDLVGGAERPEGDDHAHVAHVPALAQHQDADDAADRAVGPVDVACGVAGEVEVVLGDLAASGWCG